MRHISELFTDKELLQNSSRTVRIRLKGSYVFAMMAIGIFQKLRQMMRPPVESQKERNHADTKMATKSEREVPMLRTYKKKKIDPADLDEEEGSEMKIVSLPPPKPAKAKEKKMKPINLSDDFL